MENNNSINSENVKNTTNVVNAKSNFTNSTKTNVKGNAGFGKTVILPFVSGILGASLIVGTCFSVPAIRNKLMGQNSNSYQSNQASIDYNNINTNLVSLSSYSDTGIAVAQKVLPSVVGIKVTYSVNTIFSQNTSTATAEGSGVIISSDGYILTNNHVINSTSSSSGSYYSIGEATNLTVTLYNDSTEYKAKIIGTDSQTDLAVIKIDKTNLAAATLGDSDSVQVGEWCMAIGNPLGMKSSVTVGSISALNRSITDSEGKTYTVIQTDAAINSGNSGGALVNSKGEVIGINTIKASGTGVEGLGFSIPINSTKSIYSDLVQYNKVIRPYIGISGTDITDDTIKAYPAAKLVKGAYVRNVIEYSPAEKAGIKVGDIIVKADGKTVSSYNELNTIKNSHKIGDTIEIVVNRNGEEKTFTLTLVEQ